MKIVSQEVKTIYTIELTVSDIRVAVIDYYNSNNKHRHPRAFEWLDFSTDPHNWKDSRFLKIAKDELFLSGSADTYSYLAYYFGFDGWDHAGVWYQNKNIYSMRLFNRGEYLK